MNSQAISIQKLGTQNIPEILPFLQMLNPHTDVKILEQRAKDIFTYSTYFCFGMYDEEKLIGICGAWIMERFYSGKQIEIDNFILDETYRSQHLGEQFLFYMEDFAKEIGCLNIELNAYVKNGLAHKFYFKHGFVIKGFHFMKTF